MKRIFTFLLAILLAAGINAQVEKTVIVEHFTNSLCGTCASRNPALFALLDDYPQVLHLAFYPSAPYENCIFHQHNPAENDARTNYYGIYGGTPRVVLQGEVVGFQTPILTAEQLDNALGKTSDFSMMITQEMAGETEVNVRLVVRKVSQNANQDLRLIAVIAEKEIQYVAPNGETVHHDVFRKVLVDENLNIAMVGDSAVFNESYSLHGDWNADEIIITGMLQHPDNKVILQAYESEKLDAGSSSISEKDILSADGMIYPNPATDRLSIASSFISIIQRVDLYAITGNMVKSFDDPSDMNISDVTEGIYMVVLTDDRNRRHVTRVVKK